MRRGTHHHHRCCCWNRILNECMLALLVTEGGKKSLRSALFLIRPMFQLLNFIFSQYMSRKIYCFGFWSENISALRIQWARVISCRIGEKIYSIKRTNSLPIPHNRVFKKIPITGYSKSNKIHYPGVKVMVSEAMRREVFSSGARSQVKEFAITAASSAEKSWNVFQN